MPAMSIATIRNRIRSGTESAYQAWLALLEKYPWILKLYYLFSWISLIFLLVSLVLFRESRLMLVQYLWSFYVLVQFWLLSRSKTLTWKTTSLFMLSGVLLVIPLTNVSIQFIHLLFGGSTRNMWSTSVATPIVEEVWKLLPLGLFLFFSRKATSLSLSDYVLLGAAPGVGFQLFEELTRRWTNDGPLSRSYDYSVTLLGGKTIHWDFFELFPGYFEESFLPLMMSEGHPLHTALVALGLGLAVRFRRSLKLWVYMLPAVLLLWAILNHIAWNGQGSLPDWLRDLHKWTGKGYTVENFFLVMLAAALFIDYRALNKIRAQLPLLEGERTINPFSELWNTAESLFRDRRRYGLLLGFYRQRRELGFSLLYGNEEARGVTVAVRKSLQKYGALLGAAGLLLLLAGLFAGLQLYHAEPDSACFACLFDSLQSWWDRRSGWEQAAIIIGAFALAFMFTGFWPALGLALTGMDIAGSGHSIADIIRNPRRLLSPQRALAGLTSLLMNRIPAGRGLKWIADKLGPRGRKLLDAMKSKLGRGGRPKKPNLTEPNLPSGGSPRGRYEKPDPKDPRPITRQNETADLMANKGYDMEMLPETKGGNGYGRNPESNPDFLINGKPFDCYSPNTAKVRNIWSTVQGKTEMQTGNIVVNLDDYPGSMEALKKQFDDWPIKGLDELLVVKDGNITRWFP